MTTLFFVSSAYTESILIEIELKLDTYHVYNRILYLKIFNLINVNLRNMKFIV